MQIFELHFNPKNKNSREDKIFNSFVYEPQTPSEKRLGSLYMVGEFQKALPQNSKFLDKLASVIEKEYYGTSLQKSRETGLKNALQKANEFLDKEARSGNVNWLGNLHFAILNFKDFILNFTKVGGIKILISREKEFLDVGRNLEFQEQNPYPLKIFSSIAAGKLTFNDKIILLTKDLSPVFIEKSNLLNLLKDVSNEKDLKRILKEKEPILSEASGVCLLLLCEKETKKAKKIAFDKKKNFLNFSFPKVKTLRAPKTPRVPKFPQAPKIPQFPKVRILKINLPLNILKKNKVLFIALFFVLIIGFFVFNYSQKNNSLQIEDEQKLKEVKSKVSAAENFLIFKDNKNAEELLLEAQNILSSLNEKNGSLTKEAVSLQKKIEDDLNSIK